LFRMLIPIPQHWSQTQDFTTMIAFEEKHNVKQQQLQIFIQPHGSDPNLEMSLQGQQCNHIGK